MNKYLLYTLLLSLTVASCTEGPATKEEAAAPAPATTAQEAKPETKVGYRILNVIKNESKSKVNVDVLLSCKINESQLRAVGLALKDSIGSFDKNYLFFYLSGMKVGSGAWATVSFNPEEELRILGATQAEEDSSKSKLRVDGKVIGKWYDEQRSSSAMAFYEKNGKYFLKRSFRGSVPTVTRLTKKGNTYKPVQEPDFGEYFVVQGDGTLAFVNEEGKVFGQATPIR